MPGVKDTQIGELIASHHSTLPHWQGRARRWAWPWITLFYVAPAAGTALLTWRGLADVGASSTALLAGIGILTGFLFQVLAWTGSRLADLADGVAGRHPTSDETALLGRLDVTRANTAYATFASVVYVAELGISLMLSVPPQWLAVVNLFVLLHLSTTLLLVVLRINTIGRDDRIDTLIGQARRHDTPPMRTGTKQL
jgi:hypothetical protein